MKVCGNVESIIYRNSETGYSVVVIGDAYNSFTAVGILPPITEGESLELEGEYTTNPKFGEQFSVQSAKICLPTDMESIAKYLASGLFKGVGEVTADSIVEEFGEKTFEIIEKYPMRLREAKGISAKKAMLIHETFVALQDMQEAILYLQSLDISLNLAIKIYKSYGKASKSKIESNPYVLIEDIEGIGFITADKIAQSMGIESDSTFRVSAGIVYTLKTLATNNGHTYLPKNKLIEEVSKLLGLPLSEKEEHINNCILSLEVSGTVIVIEKEDEIAVMFNKYYLTERRIATKLITLDNYAEEIPVDVMGEIAEFERLNCLEMHENQINAVLSAIRHGVNVITGGPGTGKTTIIKCILSIFRNLNKKVQLCAPTGRAAKRLYESTGVEAKTIHRLLDLDFKNGKGYFTFNEETTLDCDVVIVDEVSMCDEYVFDALLQATRRGGRLIMVGDKDQLPSVGAGNILADIIAYDEIPVSYLTFIYRQAQESLIVSNAHRINNGQMPILRNKESDFLFNDIKDSKEVLSTVVDMVKTRIPNYLGINPFDIQVLCPMKKGISGANNMNMELQKSLNPLNEYKEELSYGETLFRTGDKVIHIKNNYNMEWSRGDETGVGVFNGDIGIIDNVNRTDGVLTVEFEDGRKAKYSRDELEELKLAYAISVHKSQGSEFDVVVIALMSGTYTLLTRNLLYTAVTRAKKMSVLVGDIKNLERMVKNNYTAKRYTMLTDFLKQEGKRQCLN